MSRVNGTVRPTFPPTLSGVLLGPEMALQQYGSLTRAPHSESTTEFEILKSSHQYVAEDALSVL